jgi:hypothetical protein
MNLKTSTGFFLDFAPFHSVTLKQTGQIDLRYSQLYDHRCLIHVSARISLRIGVHVPFEH